MEEKEHLQQLQEIRSLMERSTKFVSLSGMSGIFAGSIALLGAGIQYRYMEKAGRYMSCVRLNNDFMIFTIVNFMSILVLALLSAYYFTQKKAKANNQSVWDKSSLRLMVNLATPLGCGGLFCGVLYFWGLVGLIAPATLIFYGIALVTGSNYTLRDIRYLGFIQIALGFVACYYIGLGLFFWALGFGVMHIIYGTVMYYKYDRKI